jgi:hypothetical protein
MAAAADAILSDAGQREATSGEAMAEAAKLEAGMLRRVWAELQGPLKLPPLDAGVAGGDGGDRGHHGERHGHGA